ncbi:MAG: asparagine synthase [Firmicutes bacterium]|nr:asparagine synthase [Bacillota bacterium]
MKVREGVIPTALGGIVTLGGIALRSVNPLLGWGITGFGLAHIVLGTIDLVEHRTSSE